MPELKIKNFDLKLNGKNKENDKITWITISKGGPKSKKKGSKNGSKKKGDIFIYLSYDNGRIYSFVDKNSNNIEFNDNKNEFTYIWEGEWEGATKTYHKKIIAKLKIHSDNEYKKIKAVFGK